MRHIFAVLEVGKFLHVVGGAEQEMGRKSVIFGNEAEHRLDFLGLVQLGTGAVGDKASDSFLVGFKGHAGDILDFVLDIRTVIEFDGHCLHRFGVGIGQGADCGCPYGHKQSFCFHLESILIGSVPGCSFRHEGKRVCSPDLVY